MYVVQVNTHTKVLRRQLHVLMDGAAADKRLLHALVDQSHQRVVHMRTGHSDLQNVLDA